MHVSRRLFVGLGVLASFLIASLMSGRAMAQASIDESKVAQTLHVAADHRAAKDTNPGTAAAPLKTLSAAIAKAGDRPTKVLLAPGDYREYVQVPRGDALLVLEATEPGRAVLSGSSLYTGWKADADGTFTHDWRFAWGLGNENGWWGSTAFNRRREMVYVDGKRLEQVCDEQGGPIAADQLKPGQFTVTDNAAAPGSIRVRPPAGVDLATAKVEVAERGVQPGYTQDSRPLLEIFHRGNVVLRGLRVQHVANYIKFGGAIQIGNYEVKEYASLPRNILIENCEAIENNGIGMEIINCRDVTVRRSRFNANGSRGAGSIQLGVEPDKQIGVAVGPRNFLYEDCQFNDNNWRTIGTWGDMNDAAGYKMFGHNIDSYTFVRCQFNRNIANGFWQDYGGSNVTLDRCLIEENRGGKAGGYGALNEMTRGPFTLKDSVVRNNGNSGFISSGAPNVALERNHIYYNGVDTVFNGQRLYGHEIKINSDTGRDSADFKFGLVGWRMVGNTIASIGNPVGKGSLFVLGGPDFPNGRTCAAEFANEIVSDNNTFSKDNLEKDYFPGEKVMYSLTAANGPPDIDLATWQQVENAHGRQDQNSKFVYPIDLSNVPDPTATVNGSASR
jgi:hypothetical protein